MCSHIIFQICVGTLYMFELLPFNYEEIRRWDKSFKSGTSCDDQTPGDMQPKTQRNVTLVH